MDSGETDNAAGAVWEISLDVLILCGMKTCHLANITEMNSSWLQLLYSDETHLRVQKVLQCVVYCVLDVVG